MKFKQFLLKEDFSSIRYFLDKKDWADASLKLKYIIKQDKDSLYALKNNKYYGAFGKNKFYLITNSKLSGFNSPEELDNAIKG